MSKSTEKAQRRSKSLTALISSAANLGYAFSGGFEAAVASAHKLVPSNYLGLSEEQRKVFAAQIRDFGIQFKAGHLLKYLELRGYNKRFGNMDHAQKIAACVEIFDAAPPESDKNNRRTETEHKGCRAADNAWTRVRDAAGLKPPAQKRKPLRRAAGDEKGKGTAPVALTNLQPLKFAASSDALEAFKAIAANLHRLVNGNVLTIPPQLRSAAQDFEAAVNRGIKELKAIGHPATKRPRKSSGKARSISAIAGNGKPKAQQPAAGNGAVQ